MEGVTPRTTLSTVAGWKLGRTLGRGAYAHVRLATHPSGHQAACKILPALHRPRNGPIPWDETMDAIEAHKEVVLLKAFAGAGLKGIVGLEGVIEEGGWTYVFLTLYDRSASALTTDKPEQRPLVLNFFRQLCHIIHALHLLGISHEDLKRSNILLDKNHHPIVVDFGFSHFCPNGGYVKSAGGTLDYSSPEKVKDRYYDPKANDVWALGILLAKLLNLPHPFAPEGTNTDKLKENICSLSPNFDGLTGVNSATVIKDLLRKILNKNPSKRWTIREILKHRALRDLEPLILEYVPPSLRLPSDFPQRIPDAVSEDVCFLAYINKEFFLCETPKRIKDMIRGPGECWEKRWAGFLSKWSQKEELAWVDIPKEPRKSHASTRRTLPVPRPLQEIHLSPNIPHLSAASVTGAKSNASARSIDSAVPRTNMPHHTDKENTPKPIRKSLIGQMRGKDAVSDSTMRSHISVKPFAKAPPAPRLDRTIKTPARVDFKRKRALPAKAKMAGPTDKLPDLRALVEQIAQTPAVPPNATGEHSSAALFSLGSDKSRIELSDNSRSTFVNGGKPRKETGPVGPNPGRRSQRLLKKVGR